MFQHTFTIADTHFHAIQSCEKREDGRTVKVFAVDLHSGTTHVAELTEREVTTLLAVGLAGEEFDLPGKMYAEAKQIVQGWPAVCCPIP